MEQKKQNPNSLDNFNQQQDAKFQLVINKFEAHSFVMDSFILANEQLVFTFSIKQRHRGAHSRE